MQAAGVLHQIRISRNDANFFSSNKNKNKKNLQASLQIEKFEDEHMWRLRGQRGHQSLQAKVHNLKIKRQCSKTFRGYSSNNQIAKMER